MVSVYRIHCSCAIDGTGAAHSLTPSLQDLVDKHRWELDEQPIDGAALVQVRSEPVAAMRRTALHCTALHCTALHCVLWSTAAVCDGHFSCGESAPCGGAPQLQQ